MSDVHADKPVFQATSIRAMSPLGQEIAKFLVEVGEIQITDGVVKNGE